MRTEGHLKPRLIPNLKGKPVKNISPVSHDRKVQNYNSSFEIHQMRN